MGPWPFRSVLTSAAIAAVSLRSNGTKWNDPGWARSASSIASVSWLVSFREIAMTRYPARVSRRARPRPRPRLPPVTITLRIVTYQFAAGSHGQGGHEANRRRYLVPRQCLATALHDLVLELRHPSLRGLGLLRQHNVSDHERARDGVFPRPHE